MSDTVTFIHLTDLHVGDPAVPDEHLFSDTTANFRAILADIKRLDPQPSFIIASGDLTNRGDVASYEHLKSVLAEAALTVPVLFALGNHDTREGFYEAMLDRTENNTAPYDHDAVVAGIHVITMDSSVPKQVGGAFEPGQLEWLAARLDDHAGLPKLLVMHHAPALDEEDFIGQWESLSIADTLALRDMLRGRTDILGILSGHIHFDRVSNWYGVPLVVGVGQHAATDVAGLPKAFRMVEGASMAIGHVRPSGLTISFAPQPSTRRELHVLDMEMIRKHFGGAAASTSAQAAE